MTYRYFEITDTVAVDMIRSNLLQRRANRVTAAVWGEKHGFETVVFVGRDFFQSSLIGFEANEHYRSNLKQTGHWTVRVGSHGDVRPKAASGALYEEYKQLCEDTRTDCREIFEQLGFTTIEYVFKTLGIQYLTECQQLTDLRVFFFTDAEKGIPNGKEVSNLELLEIEAEMKKVSA